MNIHDKSAYAAAQHHPLVASALFALYEGTGVEGSLVQATPDDPTISLRIAGRSLNFLCFVKTGIDRFSALADLKARGLVSARTVLICSPLSDALAERCRQLSVQFIDTAGNAYIDDGNGVFIYVVGRKIANDVRTARRDATITPALLRFMFGILAEPALLNTSYRNIASAVGISTGAIAKAFEVMEGAGFIATTTARTRIIVEPERMLGEWATGYLQRLRPQLEKYRFSAIEPLDLADRWSPEYGVSAWGGEQAAAIVTGHLKPATFTLYVAANAPTVLSETVRRLRLRADPEGPIEIVKAFWNMARFTDPFPTVPLHLIYADLLETNDPRNAAVATLIVPKVIDHVHRAHGQTA